MKNYSESDDRFIAEFISQCPSFGLRAECAGDADFLTVLFIACSPLSATLPPEMVEYQARFQRIGLETNYPSASRFIILSGEKPVARIILDWDADGATLGVDIAVLPSEQGNSIATKLIRAWIKESTRLKRDVTFHVLADNPACALYKRLGFVETEISDQPTIKMIYRA